ncbi:K(+)-transporting ATPase subunit F [Virgibacillus sp. 7505]|nr:K(+)-transporting ATPase subunit F [Virgibacillus sp. 7505]
MPRSHRRGPSSAASFLCTFLGCKYERTEEDQHGSTLHWIEFIAFRRHGCVTGSCRSDCRERRDTIMVQIGLLVLGIGIIGYLIYALFYPEKF